MLCLAIAVFGISGCVTPIEIKTASKKQLKLISVIDSAVADLQTSLATFHKQKETRIREEGLVLIAQQAIDAAVGNKPEQEVNADELFEQHKQRIQPWIDYAFELPASESAIETIKKRIDKEKNSYKKEALQNDLDDLRLLKAKLEPKPPEVKNLEKIILDDINEEKKTAKKVKANLDILRAQVDLMKSMAQRVDTWLALDVSVTDEQIDGLKEAVAGAARKLSQGGAQ